MPVFDIPESDATGASPGALPSVWPGALVAPSPCSGFGGGSVGEYERCEVESEKREGGEEGRTLGFLLHEFCAGGLATWCFGHGCRELLASDELLGWILMKDVSLQDFVLLVEMVLKKEIVLIRRVMHAPVDRRHHNDLRQF